MSLQIGIDHVCSIFWPLLHMLHRKKYYWCQLVNHWYGKIKSNTIAKNLHHYHRRWSFNKPWWKERQAYLIIARHHISIILFFVYNSFAIFFLTEYSNRSREQAVFQLILAHKPNGELIYYEIIILKTNLHH